MSQQLASERDVRPVHIIALIIGALVFYLVASLAFALGSWRMRPDLALDAGVTLESRPQVMFDPEPRNWELVVPADDATGQGPQYATDAAGDEAVCVISWQIGSVTRDIVDLSQFSTDGEATAAVLDAAGMAIDGVDRIQLKTSTGETLELMHANEMRHDGLSSASAARAFVGSNHYILFTLVCEGTTEVTSQLMHDALVDATVELDVVR